MEYELYLYANGVLIAIEHFNDYLIAELTGSDWVSENEDDNTFKIYPELDNGFRLKYD